MMLKYCCVFISFEQTRLAEEGERDVGTNCKQLICLPFVLQGYAAEMDSPLMAHLILPGLQNKKDVLFGNMEEIYHFHNRLRFVACAQISSHINRKLKLTH